ncbi:MAG: hypothetical protein HQM16_03455 [Deltaproteobacteria bacterium]|nr:hypothetical protein [Deltaproteobacteria bacterium]
MMITQSQNNPVNPAQAAQTINISGVNAEAMMLEVQTMLAKDFDKQLNFAADQIRFLNKVKKMYREKIKGMQAFMMQKVNKSRDDGQAFYDASAAQMAGLFGSTVKIDYDTETQTVRGEKGLPIKDNGDKHTLDDVVDEETGKKYINYNGDSFSTDDLAHFFGDLAKITDPKEAYTFASNVCGDKGSLPFYLAKKEFSFENGEPKFAVYEEALNNMLDQVKNNMTDVEEEADELGTKLTQLVNQRKAAFDGLSQLIAKMDQIRSNSVSKFSNG